MWSQDGVGLSYHVQWSDGREEDLSPLELQAYSEHDAFDVSVDSNTMKYGSHDVPVFTYFVNGQGVRPDRLNLHQDDVLDVYVHNTTDYFIAVRAQPTTLLLVETHSYTHVSCR